MNRHAVVAFFKPSLIVVVLTGLFVSAMVFGLADRYAFTCGGSGHKCEGIGIEKPLLYDIPCGCWLIWTMSSAPLLWLQYHASPTITEFIQDSSYIETSAFGSYSLIGFAANIVYYYLGSCVAAFIWRKMRSRPSEDVQHVKS